MKLIAEAHLCRGRAAPRDGGTAQNRRRKENHNTSASMVACDAGIALPCLQKTAGIDNVERRQRSMLEQRDLIDASVYTSANDAAPTSPLYRSLHGTMVKSRLCFRILICYAGGRWQAEVFSMTYRISGYSCWIAVSYSLFCPFCSSTNLHSHASGPYPHRYAHSCVTTNYRTRRRVGVKR